MTNKRLTYWIIGIVSLLFVICVAFVVWGILFAKQAGWRPPDDYKEPAKEPRKELNPDSVNLETLHDYLKREQYGNAPLLEGNYWKSRDTLEAD